MQCAGLLVPQTYYGLACCRNVLIWIHMPEDNYHHRTMLRQINDETFVLYSEPNNSLLANWSLSLVIDAVMRLRQLLTAHGPVIVN
jgi:hypothetical protein